MEKSFKRSIGGACAVAGAVLMAGAGLLPAAQADMSEYAVGTGNSILMSGGGECWRAADGKTGNLPECGWTPPDTDGDGKIDEIDHCPDTPKGVMVNESGCPLDWDHDGVPNDEDACADTPKIAKVDSLGCPLDADNDRVPDYKDKCPGTPRGKAVNARGCFVDDDNDGVANVKDKCPNTVAGVEVDDDGCAKVGETLSVHQIEFDTGSAKIKDQYQAGLDQDVAVLQANPDMAIDVVGHTDSVGDAAYNMALSEKRAEAVKSYLEVMGVDGARMNAMGKGESEPVADNVTAAGRAQNRRVELTVSAK